MESSSGVLRQYEDLLQVSRQMLLCARQEQWEELVLLEKNHAKLAASLAGEAGPISASDSLRIAELIGMILKQDAETQSLAASWKNELQDLLGSMNTERKLSRTYGP